jgi:hypothetical protein
MDNIDVNSFAFGVLIGGLIANIIWILGTLRN